MNGFWGTYWNIWQLVRWSITSIILVVLSEYLALQIISLLLISDMVQGLLVTCNPLNENGQNKMAIFNEIMVSVYLYILISLSISLTSSNREQTGMLLVAVILASFIANLFNFIVRGSTEAYIRLK